MHPKMTRAQHPDGLALMNPHGEARGFVDPKLLDGQPVLEDLWVMQGSLCDLRCKHCYTASSPTNNRLEQITCAELAPHLKDAASFGVQKIYFTGGEVFVNEDVLRGRAAQNDEFLESLAMALEIAPVEVLTNGRLHIRNHFEALRRLRERHGDRLILRITLESPDAAGHDAIRGRGTFAQTTETIRLLAEMDFPVVVAAERPLLDGRSDGEIRESYRSLFPGASVEVSLIENMLEMGHYLTTLARRGETPHAEVFVTTNCFAALGRPPESLMCHFSRAIQKIDGELRYYPCPVICDDPRFEMGATLAESLRRVYIAHKNCYDYCMKGRGATCRTRAI
ncbi:MAG TPA: radical SAM protein [Bryobacteraceae bacterium]|nr:radical SAM protein [Bryobacteraceae bacterium]